MSSMPLLLLPIGLPQHPWYFLSSVSAKLIIMHSEEGNNISFWKQVAPTCKYMRCYISSSAELTLGNVPFLIGSTVTTACGPNDSLQLAVLIIVEKVMKKFRKAFRVVPSLTSGNWVFENNVVTNKPLAQSWLYCCNPSFGSGNCYFLFLPAGGSLGRPLQYCCGCS